MVIITGGSGVQYWSLWSYTQGMWVSAAGKEAGTFGRVWVHTGLQQLPEKWCQFHVHT